MANPVPTEAVPALYAMTGGDYEGVVGRLRKDDRIAKFVTMFADDPSYENLVANMESQNWDEAFRASHTLKGVARDMGFITISENASEVCEALRAENPDLAQELLPALQEEYTRVAEAIAAFRE